MTSPELDKLLEAITDQLRAAEQQQRQDTEPAHEDFYTWGAFLDEATAQLYRVCRALAPQVTRYGDHRILRDDAGADPEQRLATARQQLDTLISTLELANTTARAYHSAIGHIAVEVDPHTTA